MKIPLTSRIYWSLSNNESHSTYPLVNVYKTMEHHHFWVNQRTKWPFFNSKIFFFWHLAPGSGWPISSVSIRSAEAVCGGCGASATDRWWLGCWVIHDFSYIDPNLMYVSIICMYIYIYTYNMYVYIYIRMYVYAYSDMSRTFRTYIVEVRKICPKQMESKWAERTSVTAKHNETCEFHEEKREKHINFW